MSSNVDRVHTTYGNTMIVNITSRLIYDITLEQIIGYTTFGNTTIVNTTSRLICDITLIQIMMLLAFASSNLVLL